jgi:hypothetical protein
MRNKCFYLKKPVCEFVPVMLNYDITIRERGNSVDLRHAYRN